MSNDTSYPSPDEARNALASAGAIERAALRRGLPPRWFGVAIALLVGGLVAAPAVERWSHAPDRGLITLFLVLGIAVVIAQRERLGPRTRDFPDGRAKTIVMLMVAIATFFALFIAGIALRDAGDLWWGPLLTGAVGTLLVLVLANSERRSYAARAATEASSEPRG